MAPRGMIGKRSEKMPAEPPAGLAEFEPINEIRENTGPGRFTNGCHVEPGQYRIAGGGPVSVQRACSDERARGWPLPFPHNVIS